MKRRAARTRGFTLIELMVCIAMASALGAVAVPKFVGQRIRAAQQECKVVFASMNKLQTIARNDYGRPLTGPELLTFGGLDPKTLSGAKFYEFTFTDVLPVGSVKVVAQDSRHEIYPGWPDIRTITWFASNPGGGGGGGGGGIGGGVVETTDADAASAL